MAQPNSRDQLKLREQDLVSNTVEFPRRFPLVINPSNRGSSTAYDGRLVNCYTERDKLTGEYSIFGRPGILTYSTKSGNGLGVYNWLGNVYSIFGTKIYKDGVDMGAAALNTAGGLYHWDESLSPLRLVFKNGTNAYFTDGTTVTVINDADFPATTVPGWGFLDATLYVMGATALINGSDLNSVSSFDPLNVLTAQIEPDPAVALTKQLVYVIAMKAWSTEVFFDASNATGSPLGRVQGAKINWGCMSGESVQEINGMHLWVATYKKGNQSTAVAQVVLLDKLKDRIVSTPAVERLLEAADFTTVYAFTIAMNGHRFYVLTLKVSNLTLAYDIDEDMWAQWTDSSGNYWPIIAVTSGPSQTHLLQHETNGVLYYMSPSYVTDDGSLITVDIYTPNFDGGVRRRKMLDRLEYIGNRVAGSKLQVRSNDSDFDPAKWTDFRTVALDQERPYLDGNGTFQQRAYNFRHKCNCKFHMAGAEMQLGMGTL